MRALVWNGPGALALETRPEPEAAPGEVLLKVLTVGICGSEVEGYLGESAIRKPPLIMGHECAGEVVAVGEGVTGVATGERVSLNPLLSCGRCPRCREGQQQQCPDRQLVGAQRPGAFAEYVAVPAENVYVLPPGTSEVAGAVTEPLACCIHAVDRSGIGIGGRAAVIGFGSLGVLLTQALQWAGVEEIVVVEPDAGRRAIAEGFGATAALDPAAAAEAGGALDVAFDTVGKGVTRALSVDLLRTGGSAVLLGLHDEGFPIDGNAFLRRELTMISSYAYNRTSFARAVDVLPRVGLDGWITFGGLEDGPSSFKTLIEDPTGPPKIMMRP
jgi:2-desacetyl-2-hydroxyethyl bacteriochlorophyllide A dehydrogenase